MAAGTATFMMIMSFSLKAFATELEQVKMANAAKNSSADRCRKYADCTG
jgi:hypothetical protein